MLYEPHCEIASVVKGRSERCERAGARGLPLQQIEAWHAAHLIQAVAKRVEPPARRVARAERLVDCGDEHGNESVKSLLAGEAKKRAACSCAC